MNFIKHNKDITNILLLFVFAVVITYKTPQMIGTLFQGMLLVLFWRSQNDYFWLAFVLIIKSEIGFLFPMADPQFSFSLIPNSPVGNLYFSLVFLILATVKAFNKKPAYPLIIKNQVLMLSCYFLLLLIVFGAFKITVIFRLTLPWLLLFIVPRVLTSDKDIYYFFRLIFPFVFIVILSQMLYLKTGYQLATYFGGVESLSIRSGETIADAERAMRPIYGIFIPFIALWGSLFFLTLKKTYFSKNYLYIILGISTFSIFITATRSWLVAVAFLIGFFLLITSINKGKTLIQIFGIGTIIILATSYVPLLQKQANLSYSRYETLQSFAAGDITAGGTLKRFDVRAKTPMKGFWKNPVIGWGVGKEYSSYADGHVGYHNLLMSSGVIGFVLWMLLWIIFMFKLLVSNNKLAHSNPYKNTPLIIIAFTVSIMIIHASAQWFGFLINFTNALAVAFLFSIGSHVYHSSKLLTNTHKTKTKF